jgi:microcystin-dependent protein
MAQPYVGEIRMFAGNFAPAGWMFCEGQLLPISDYQTLYNLIGTTYGGDGQSTFALPDMRGRIPLHMGNGFTLAENGGVEQVTLTVSQIPSHSHALLGTASLGQDSSALNDVLAESTTFTQFTNSSPTVAMSTGTGTATGGNQPHTNFQPYLCVDFIISLFGIFPSQT